MATRKVSTTADRASGYSRRAIEMDILMSAANTIAFSEIDLNLSIEDGEVVVLHRAEFWLADGTLTEYYTTAGAGIQVGVVNSDSIGDLQLAQRALYGSGVRRSLAANSPGSTVLPIRISWELLPGGGIPVPPAPLFFAIDTVNFTVAGQCSVQLFYSVITVKPATALQILKSFVPQAF